MAERVVTVTVKGQFTDHKDPHELTDMINDAITRESKVLEAGGFILESVESAVSVTIDGPMLDRATGIEDVRRICNDCHQSLGYEHAERCGLGAGQVELAETVAE